MILYPDKKKLKLLEDNFGNNGYIVYTKLLMEFGGKQKIELTPEKRQRILDKSLLPPDVYRSVFKYCLDIGCFRYNSANMTLQVVEELPSDLFGVFKDAIAIYPGISRGVETEFKAFRRKHKDYASAIPLLKNAILAQIQDRKVQNSTGFNRSWKNLSGWLGNRLWEETVSQSTVVVDKKFIY